MAAPADMDDNGHERNGQAELNRQSSNSYNFEPGYDESAGADNSWSMSQSRQFDISWQTSRQSRQQRSRSSLFRPSIASGGPWTRGSMSFNERVSHYSTGCRATIRASGIVDNQISKVLTENAEKVGTADRRDMATCLRTLGVVRDSNLSIEGQPLAPLRSTTTAMPRQRNDFWLRRVKRVVNSILCSGDFSSSKDRHHHEGSPELSSDEEDLVRALFPLGSTDVYLGKEHLDLDKIVKQVFGIQHRSQRRIVPAELSAEARRVNPIEFASALSSVTVAATLSLKSRFTGYLGTSSGDSSLEVPRRWSFQLRHLSRIRRCSSRIINNAAFSGLFAILTLYILIVPDVVLFADTDLHDETFPGINSGVFILFIIELALKAAGQRYYWRTLSFYLDLVCLCSVLPDTVFVKGWSGDWQFVARLARTARLARLLMLARMTRIGCIMNVLWAVPTRVCRQGSAELARRLVVRRLWRIFIFMDTDQDGFVRSFDLRWFYLIALFSFRKLLKHTLSQLLEDDIFILRAFLEEAQFEEDSDMGFEDFSEIILKTSFARDLVQIQAEDLHQDGAISQKAHQVSGLSSLKICMGLLILIAGKSLLKVDARNSLSVWQSLGHLDMLAQAEHNRGTWNSSLLCRHVDLLRQEHNVLYAFFDGEIFVDGGSKCDAILPFLSIDPQIRAGQVVADNALQLSEARLQVACLPFHKDCPRQPHRQAFSSLIVVDCTEVERSQALSSLIVTLTAMFLFFVFIYNFAGILQDSIKTNVEPIHWLTDDMAAMTAFDLLGLNVKAIVPGDTKPIDWGCQVEEVVMLQDAINSLRPALKNWSIYVPPCVVQRLMSAGVEADIGAKTVHATVLFCDIIDFEETCQKLEPDEVLRLLSVVFGVISDTIDTWNGTLLEFIGDEILAVFNTPNKVKNHAVAAANACQDLHAAIQDGAAIEIASILDGKAVSIGCRCGLNTAYMLAGNIGSPERMKYGLLGDGINLAARLKALNSRYGTKTLMSQTVVEHSGAGGRKSIWRPVDVVAVKGKTKPTTIFEAMPAHCGHERGVQLHEEAFKLYQTRKFEDARSRFQEAGEAIKANMSAIEDKPSMLLQARCSAFIKEPPPADWDGVDRLKAKTFAPEIGPAISFADSEVQEREVLQLVATVDPWWPGREMQQAAPEVQVDDPMIEGPAPAMSAMSAATGCGPFGCIGTTAMCSRDAMCAGNAISQP